MINSRILQTLQNLKKKNVMKKFFSTKNLAVLAMLGLLTYNTVKLHRLEERMGLLVKPSKKFSVNQVLNKFPYNPNWEVTCAPETAEFVNMLTQQPFYYLGKGFQATAFASQDGEYVIKFFHQSRLRDKTFTEDPIGYFSKEKVGEKQAHREEIFSSSKMAFEEFPEEAGFIYVHLNRTNNLIKGIKLFDFMGQAHRVKGDDTSFIVQKRAEYIVPVMKGLIKSGNMDGAKARLNQIFDLLLSLTKKGFIDGDTALIRNNNIGFAKDGAIYIDTGHITRQPDVNIRERMQFEFDVRLAPLHDWLKFVSPELAAYFKERQEEILESIPPSEKALEYNKKEKRAKNTREKRNAQIAALHNF